MYSYLNNLVKPTETTAEGVARLRSALQDADAVVIGAGSGLSTSAGYLYTGERFEQYFKDFQERYGITDMYSGGFYPFHGLTEYWAWWSRHIWVNRYAPIPNDTYDALRQLVERKDYFVLTTNVDHCFQRAGFEKERMFYTQGDYGLWQCSRPCHKLTYDNEKTVREMLLAQGFAIADDGALSIPEGVTPAMTVPEELIPHCPVCGRPMTMNLRADDTFVEDGGWHAHAERYKAFLERTEGKKVLYLELGVGGNTPVIIKYPFWRLTKANPNATYACLSRSSAMAPKEIADRSICLNGDITDVLRQL